MLNSTQKKRIEAMENLGYKIDVKLASKKEDYLT